jgi:vacuolar-type H+-ATPase subunit H
MSDIAAESPSVIDLLDRLEGLVVNGKRIVFTPNVLVNEDEALDLVDRARIQLPEEIKQAHWVIDEQESIIGRARETAEAIVEEARAAAERDVAGAREEAERAAALVSGHAVARAAEERARTLVHEAEEQASHVSSEADAYAREVMETLEGQLQRTVQTVRKGLESLPSPDAQGRRRR